MRISSYLISIVKMKPQVGNPQQESRNGNSKLEVESAAFMMKKKHKKYYALDEIIEFPKIDCYV